MDPLAGVHKLDGEYVRVKLVLFCARESRLGVWHMELVSESARIWSTPIQRILNLVLPG
jgi:hypothetical protein